MENTNRSKRTAKVTFGDPLNWKPRPTVSHFQCNCAECQRLTAWTKGYQKYLRQVDR